MLIPDDGGFPLVGNADGSNVGSGSADVCHGLLGHFQLCGENFVCIMLHPTGLGEDLGEFLLCHAAYIAGFVKENAAVGGGAGIQRHNIFRHDLNSLFLKMPPFARGQKITLHGCGC